MSGQAVRLLREMGYERVREYPGGMKEWTGEGLPVESGETPSAPARTTPKRTATTGKAPSVATPAPMTPARVARPALPRMSPWDQVVLQAGNRTVGFLIGSWLAIVAGFGVFYWTVEALGLGHLREGGTPLVGNLHGLWASIYFSFVTATSVGFGDVTPVGFLRLAAICEAALGLLLFGIVISRFVSRRQDQLMEELHKLAWEDRLGRVRANLHMVVTELQGIGLSCGTVGMTPERSLLRVESTATVFAGELRAVHDLLYRPERFPEESVLEILLGSVASALGLFGEILRGEREGAPRSAVLKSSLGTIRRLAEEICGDCVPVEYAPDLKAIMDRIQALAGEIR